MRIPRSVRAGALVFAVLPIWPTASATAADEARVSPDGVTELRPDMIMGRLEDWQLETMPNGQVRLLFGTIGWNVGDGPLHLNAHKPNPGDDYMTAKQRILRSDDTWRVRRTPSVIFWATDGHFHWHARQFMTVTLYERGQGAGDVYGLRKIGYCLVDARRQASPPPGSPVNPQYTSCGSHSDDDVTMGMSIGWGDWYPATYEHQWMNITDLPTGRYRVCATVDPLGEFVEKRENNNQRWTDVRINKELGTVAVRATGGIHDACGPGIP